MDMYGLAEVWERQPSETARQHELLTSYLELGPGRSLPELAEATGAGIASLRQMARRLRWAQRARAFDQHQAYVRYQESERRAGIVAGALTGAVEQMTHLAGRRLRDMQPEDVDPELAVRMVGTAARAIPTLMPREHPPPVSATAVGRAWVSGQAEGLPDAVDDTRLEVGAHMAAAATGGRGREVLAALAGEPGADVDQVMAVLMRALDRHPEVRAEVLAELEAAEDQA